jgi:hypothetical protein
VRRATAEAERQQHSRLLSGRPCGSADDPHRPWKTDSRRAGELDKVDVQPFHQLQTNRSARHPQILSGPLELYVFWLTMSSSCGPSSRLFVSFRGV